MEARALTGPEFWDDDAPVLMGVDLAVPRGIPGLVYFRTSGSTGAPRWIGLSRHALQVSAEAVNGLLGVVASSCWALALPLEHVGGFGVVARAYQAGCRLVRFDRKWNAPEFAAWAADQRPSHLSLVPTQVHDLVTAGLRAPGSIRAVVVGGGVLAEATGRAARDLGWPVLASYGMTEAGSQVATQGLELLDVPYVNRPIRVLPCWDVRIEGDGRIAIRGDALFSGTLGDDMKYEERRGKWHVTSDSGCLAGRDLTVDGRKDMLVKILGELVDPLAVENEILTRGSLAPGRIAVLAVDDVRAGHRLVLACEKPVPAAAVASALDSYHAACPGFLRISGVVEVERIPRSPLGKVQRRELARIIGARQI